MARNESEGSKKVKLKRMKIKKDKQTNGAETSGRKGKKRAGRVVMTILKIFFFTFIAVAIIAVGVVLGVLGGIIDDTEALQLEALSGLKLTTMVYDKDGNEIDTLSDENRILAEYKDFPKYLIDAVISIEDERYHEHGGVDIKGTANAIIQYVMNGGTSARGGSTITQQLVKNITQDKSRNWQRKVREWYRAISLEKQLNKEQILESYLNTIYFGSRAYGIEAAAQTYFAKTISEVNLAEAAILAAIIQSPEGMNPYTSEKSKAALLDRQKVVLYKMLELGKISQTEYDEALEYELVFEKSNLASGIEATTYYVDAALEAVIADLESQKNMTRAAALQLIYSSGLKIYTTMDPKVQATIDRMYQDTSIFTTNYYGNKLQSAMVIIENSTGKVVGIAGGTDADKKEDSFSFNRATMMTRQSGSAIKPLSTYGPAFELGVSYPGMGVDDSYISISNWTPVNVTGTYAGYVSTRYAIIQSINIAAVKTLQKVGISYSYTFLKNMGISTLTNEDKNLAALALGGQSDGVKVIDMAAAYTAIARGGIYVTPTFYTKVEDKDGNVILEPDIEYKRVMKETTAYLLTDTLRSVVTAGYARSYFNIKSSIAFAGKTGTTNDALDKWFCGYTPYYTGAVWAGYDDNKSAVYGYPTLVAFNYVMRNIHEQLGGASFSRPGGLVNAEVCTVSGLVATDACRKDPRSVISTELFISGTVPTATCNIHTTAKVCSASGKLATEFCELYEDVEINEVGFVTRDSIPERETLDWSYMLWEESPECDIHTEEPEIEEDEDVNIYEEEQD